MSEFVDGRGVPTQAMDTEDREDGEEEEGG
jgi:hypothetical protein